MSPPNFRQNVDELLGKACDFILEKSRILYKSLENGNCFSKKKTNITLDNASHSQKMGERGFEEMVNEIDACWRCTQMTILTMMRFDCDQNKHLPACPAAKL